MSCYLLPNTFTSSDGSQVVVYILLEALLPIYILEVPVYCSS